MPGASDSDSMAVTRGRNHGCNVAGVVLCRPKSVCWDFDRRESNPFATRGAGIVEVETGMVIEDRETASDQHHQKEEVEEMAVAHPEGESMRTGEVTRIHLQNRRDIGKTENKNLYPCRKYRQQNQYRGGN